MYKYSKYIFIVFIVSLVAIVAGSLNSTTTPTDKYHLDKIIHFGAFGFLSFLMPLFIKSKKKLLLCLSVIICIGGGIEIVQSNISGRTGSWADFIADVLGVIVGSLLCLLFKEIKSSKFKSGRYSK